MKMAVQVQETTCYTCKYFKEGYYKYYTHDNRMIECYSSGCQKQLERQKEDTHHECIHWEANNRF